MKKDKDIELNERSQFGDIRYGLTYGLMISWVANGLLVVGLFWSFSQVGSVFGECLMSETTANMKMDRQKFDYLNAQYEDALLKWKFFLVFGYFGFCLSIVVSCEYLLFKPVSAADRTTNPLFVELLGVVNHLKHEIGGIEDELNTLKDETDRIEDKFDNL